MFAYIFWGILIFSLGLIFVTISIYNNLTTLKALVDEAWSGIQIQLKRRYDLIPNLVAIVKGSSTHEKNTLEEIVRLRSLSMHAESVQEKALSEGGLSTALKTLFAVAENYPTLKANEGFLQLQKDLQIIEQEIQLARRYYNGTARNYNSTIAKFPTMMIASMMHFTPVAYFDLPAVHEQNAPHIEF